MEREIKFRGLTKSGEWVYGLLHTCVGKTKIREAGYRPGEFSEREVELNISWILKPNLPTDTGWSINDSFQAYEVIPETVGQYTGLKDKAGNRIFEGDILSYDGADHKKQADWMNLPTYVVKYDDEYYPAGHDIKPERKLFCHAFRFPYCTIIDNIYQHPELLTK